MEDRIDLVFVSFQGELLACTTISDAEAIQAANELLSRFDVACCPASELERLATILVGHGQTNAAARLQAEAARMRAADVVSHGATDL